MLNRLGVVGLCCGLLLGGGARAETAPPLPRPPPDRPLFFTSVLAAQINPLGLEEQLYLGYQHRLYESSDVAFQDNFITIMVDPRLSPAGTRLGGAVEFQPASFFQLRASLALYKYFGNFSYLLSFPSPTSAFNDALINTRLEAHENVAALGLHASVEPLFQIQVGPIAVRDKITLEYWNYPTKAGDRVVFEASLDTLISADGWTLTNDADLLYIFEGSLKGLVLGLHNTIIQPLYKEADFVPGETVANLNGQSRLGVLGAYTFFDRGRSTFNKPAVFVIAGAYLHHNYRAGPYVALGFAFETDLVR